MHWFHALYSMSAVFMLIGLFWQIAVIPLSFIIVAFGNKAQTFLMFIIMLIPYYLMASYAVLVGIGVNNGERHLSTLIIGGLFLLFHGLLGIYQAQKDAQKNNDYMAYKLAGNRYTMILLALIYYVFAIFKTQLTINWLTLWLFHVMQWIQNIPIIGWIVGIVSIIYVIYMMFVVIIMLIGIAANFSTNKTSQSDNI
jgi:hypothetical protein